MAKKPTVKATNQPSPIPPTRKAALQSPSNYIKKGKRMISPNVNNVGDAEAYDSDMNSVRNSIRFGKVRKVK